MEAIHITLEPEAIMAYAAFTLTYVGMMLWLLAVLISALGKFGCSRIVFCIAAVGYALLMMKEPHQYIDVQLILSAAYVAAWPFYIRSLFPLKQPAQIEVPA